MLFGTLVAETILASVHVRAHRQAGHMDASDLIKTLQKSLQGGGRPHTTRVPGAGRSVRSLKGREVLPRLGVCQIALPTDGTADPAL